jgi:hypothetical protein
MDAAVPSTEDFPTAYAVSPLKPALASIKSSCEYLGGISRAKFYADILPLLETVKLGNRNFVVIESIDRLIQAKRGIAAPDDRVFSGGCDIGPALPQRDRPVEVVPTTPSERARIAAAADSPHLRGRSRKVRVGL